MTPLLTSRPSANVRTIAFVSVLVVWSVSLFAQARPERLADKDVKALIEQVDVGRDKFEGNLDGDFKGSTVQGPNGQVKVSGALQDYQDSTQKLKDRFSRDYSAGPEVATVLKQSASIDAFMLGSPPSMKGRSEWDRQVTNLKHLAAAYGTSFPLADGAAVRRMGDKETAAEAEAIADAADRVKRDIDKTTALAQPDKDDATKEVELLARHANAVKSRIGDGKPATAEMQQLVEQTARVEGFVATHRLSAMPNWQAVQASVAKLQQAFGSTP